MFKKGNKVHRCPHAVPACLSQSLLPKLWEDLSGTPPVSVAEASGLRDQQKKCTVLYFRNTQTWDFGVKRSYLPKPLPGVINLCAAWQERLWLWNKEQRAPESHWGKHQRCRDHRRVSDVPRHPLPSWRTTCLPYNSSSRNFLEHSSSKSGVFTPKNSYHHHVSGPTDPPLKLMSVERSWRHRPQCGQQPGSHSVPLHGRGEGEATMQCHKAPQSPNSPHCTWKIL